MKQLITYPAWIIVVFSFFCLTQVRHWFEEILDGYEEDGRSFTYLGQLFSLLPPRSFIVDESLKQYGIQRNYLQQMN